MILTVNVVIFCLLYVILAMENVREQKKKRKAGEGSVQFDKKIKRSQGLEYVDNRRNIVLAKVEPTATVS